MNLVYQYIFYWVDGVMSEKFLLPIKQFFLDVSAVVADVSVATGKSGSGVFGSQLSAS